MEAFTPEAAKLRDLLHDALGWNMAEDAGIGVKPVSKTGSQRLQRAALNYAVRRNRKRVHWVHKGNIMKFTEGAFRGWGYELVREEFSDVPWAGRLRRRRRRQDPGARRHRRHRPPAGAHPPVRVRGVPP